MSNPQWANLGGEGGKTSIFLGDPMYYTILESWAQIQIRGDTLGAIQG
jgi:hypothetical protein